MLTPEQRDNLRDELHLLSLKLADAEDAMHDEERSATTRHRAERDAIKLERAIADIEATLEEDQTFQETHYFVMRNRRG